MNLSNHFLIAMPEMDDSMFGASVVYLCEHSEEGAMGVIINKPSNITLEHIFTANGQMMPWRYHKEHLLIGGPLLPERGFVLHTPHGNWQSSLTISEHTALTTSNDIIEHLGNTSKIHQAIITMGYSSWGKGQLEQELAQNAWLTVAADTDILFEVPANLRYEAALQKLGIRSSNLIGKAAYA